ncbi:hypothetical protein ABG067_003837 [Albugo candida]
MLSYLTSTSSIYRPGNKQIANCSGTVYSTIESTGRMYLKQEAPAELLPSRIAFPLHLLLWRQLPSGEIKRGVRCKPIRSTSEAMRLAT